MEPGLLLPTCWLKQIHNLFVSPLIKAQPFADLFLHIFFLSTTTKYKIAGGGTMKTLQDPPPPPLASDVAMSSLQCQMAVENLCVATSNLLSQIRTLRLSLLLMDETTISAEEEWQVHQMQLLTSNAQEESNILEQEWVHLRNQELD